MLHAVSIIALGKYCHAHVQIQRFPSFLSIALPPMLQCPILTCLPCIIYVIPSPTTFPLTSPHRPFDHLASPPLPLHYIASPPLPLHYRASPSPPFESTGTARSEVTVYASMAFFSAGACALPMVLGFLTDEVNHITSNQTAISFI